MDEKQTPGPDPHYEETTAPQNPPNSMVGSDARAAWLSSSVGLLSIICIVVAAAFAFVFVQRELGRGARDNPAEAVGTSGAHQPREGSPGGFDPGPRPDNTREELKYRGVGKPGDVSMPGLTAAAVADADDVDDAAPGSRVALMDVTVDRADGETFWIRNGDDTIVVVTQGGTPTVHAGQRVNISGTIEKSGDSRWIRASRIDVK